MHPLTARHPRYTIALIVFFFVAVLYYANAGSSSTAMHPLRNPSRPPSLTKVNDVIRLHEGYYKQHLKNRKKLIEKFGPTVDEVESFPTNRDYFTLWDYFIPAFQCPHRVERIGTLGDGGKWVCGFERVMTQPKCVVYSFGINGESSFEAEILERAPGCQLWGYDFSVNDFGPEIAPYKSRSHFSAYGLAGKDAHGSTDDPKMYTLATLMKQNGHKFIDILKIDIEGAEFDSLKAFIEAFPDTLPVGQLQLEVHARGEHSDFAYFLKWWETLERAGLRPFWTEPNLVYINLVRGVKPELSEYSFINIKGDHILIRD